MVESSVMIPTWPSTPCHPGAHTLRDSLTRLDWESDHRQVLHLDKSPKHRHSLLVPAFWVARYRSRESIRPAVIPFPRPGNRRGGSGSGERSTKVTTNDSGCAMLNQLSGTASRPGVQTMVVYRNGRWGGFAQPPGTLALCCRSIREDGKWLWNDSSSIASDIVADRYRGTAGSGGVRRAIEGIRLPYQCAIGICGMVVSAPGSAPTKHKMRLL